jgi:hypothetical protein
MIEAMACGTPVIAFNHGSVPEVVTDGVSGFVVETVEEAVAAVARIAEIDRGGVRAAFEERFSVDVMAANYEAAYKAVLGLSDGAPGMPLPIFAEALAQGKAASGDPMSLHKAEARV